MPFTPRTQAVLLLTAALGNNAGSITPLTAREWARFRKWLHDQHREPADLLDNEKNVLEGWPEPDPGDKLSRERLEALLRRGPALGIAAEKWQRAGLWVLTRSDEPYPRRLKALGREAPPALFGCGERTLLAGGGIAVVGSRHAARTDVSFAEALGLRAAEQGITIVSGGARGIDQAAMMSALENGGVAVGVLADSLLRAAMSRKYRQFLMSGRLALVTPFNPEARFEPWKAMARNQYIYGLADAGVVVCSTAGKGGTWNGAMEQLKAEMSNREEAADRVATSRPPLWVRMTDQPSPGNADLSRRPRAHEMRALPDDLRTLFTAPIAAVATGRVATSSGTPPRAKVQAEGGEGREMTESAGERPAAVAEGPDFYGLFMDWMRKATAAGPIREEDANKHFHLERAQLRAWLKKGVEDKRLRKLTRPVQYEWLDDATRQQNLYPDREVSPSPAGHRAARG